MMYKIEITREGRWWMVSIPEIDGLTQARRLSEVKEMAREYIAVTLDVPISGVGVALSRISVDDVAVSEIAANIEHTKAEVERLSREVALESERLAKELAEHEVPMRDIGTVLDVSHQRAHQLVNH